MTTVYFVRHGETSYKEVDERSFIGHGRDLAQLTKKGIEQLKLASKDKRLIGSEIIISSPYTRALQSASILSKELNIDIEIDIDLHEWLPDKTFQYRSSQESFDFYHDFEINKGIYPYDTERKWETEKSVKCRMENAIQRYLHYKKIIVVSHGIVIEALSGIHLDHGCIAKYIFRKKESGLDSGRAAGE